MRNFILIFMLAFGFLTSKAQENIKFESTASIGTFSFLTGLVMVDPGPGWEGYNLPREQKTGIQAATINGISISEFFHIGIGAGYANFDKKNGLMLFGDIRADFSKKPFALFVYANPGYSHFWNQYDGGTGTAMFDFGFGARYKILEKSKALISVGLLCMQQSSYISVKLGYTF